MADVNYTLKADIRRQSPIIPGKGEAANLKILTATRSVTARTNGDTMKMMSLPTTARISVLSRVSWDDLASTGSPTLSVGLGSQSNNITTSATALNSGIDLATAAGTTNLLNDHANSGKQLWELAGATSDPGGLIDIYVTFAAANTNTTGDVTIDCVFSFD